MKNKLKIVQKKLEDLIPYVNNPRKNDHAVDNMAAAIKEFGFLVPVLVKSDNTVVDGHLRLKSANKLKLDTVPCIEVDHLSDPQIKALRLNINRMAELADWDADLLKIELDDLKLVDFDMDGFGFDDKFLSEFKFENETPDFPPASEDDQGQLDEIAKVNIQCPYCDQIGDKNEFKKVDS